MRIAGDPIPLRNKVGYAATTFASDGYVALSINIYLLFFYVDVLGLDAGVAGFALLAGKIWDAITDPLMGHLSDRTVCRYGRRRPYIFGGGLLLSTAVWMLWDPWFALTDSRKGLYLFLFYLLYSTGYTITIVPYSALGAELSSDYYERTRLFTVTSIAGSLGGLAAALSIPWILLNSPENPLSAFALTGYLCAGTLVIGVTWTVLTTKERSYTGNGRESPIWLTCKDALRNKPFQILLMVFVIASIGIIIVISTLAFVAKHVLKDEGLLSLILVTTMTASVVSLPATAQLILHVGKKYAYGVVLILTSACLAASVVMLRPGNVPMVFCWSAWFGVCSGGMVMLPKTILPDIIDEDEIVSWQRREGIYSGLLTLATKASAGIGVGLAGFGLKFVGVTEAEIHSDRVILFLRILLGPIPAVLLAVCAVLFIRFPIVPSRAERTSQTLRERRGATKPG